MIKLILVTFLLTISFRVQSENKAIIQAEKEGENISVGDSFWAKVYLIPENPSSNIEEFLHATDLTKAKSEQIDIVEVGSKKISENNHDIIEAQALMFLKKEIEGTGITFSLDDIFYFAKFSGFSLDKNKVKQTEGYVVLDTKYTSYFDFYKYRYLIIIFSIVISYYSFRYYLKVKKKKKTMAKLEELKKHWSTIFKNAFERNQYEYIIKNQDECKNAIQELYGVQPKLQDKQALLDSFFRNNREYFYQERWSNEIQENINKSFNYLRDIFDGEFRI